MKTSIFISFFGAVLLAISPLVAAHQGKASDEAWTEDAQKKHEIHVKHSPLFHAIDHRDLAEVKRLLKDGADPNKADKRGITALMVIAALGDVEIVKMLLERGANPNHAQNQGVTALMGAILTRRVETVKILLDGGADPNLSVDGGETALMRAAAQGYTKIIKMLLDHGAEPNQLKGDYGITALMEAVYQGQPEAARILLEGGANPDLRNHDGKTAWDYIKGKKYMEVVFEEAVKKYREKQNSWFWQRQQEIEKWFK